MPASDIEYAAAAVNCPICDKPAPDGRNRWRPFCSERCKLADLDQWFAGRYAIPAEPEPDAAPATAPERRQ